MHQPGFIKHTNKLLDGGENIQESFFFQFYPTWSFTVLVKNEHKFNTKHKTIHYPCSMTPPEL